MTIYSAEDEGGDLFVVAGWDGLDRPGFRAFVLEQLRASGIPEPDRNIQQLDLCEWEDTDFAEWNSSHPTTPGAYQAWKNANFATLYWTYPGVWADEPVTTMPPELAAEFSGGECYDLDDPKHPTWHDRMAGAWDNRDKEASLQMQAEKGEE